MKKQRDYAKENALQNAKYVFKAAKIPKETYEILNKKMQIKGDTFTSIVLKAVKEYIEKN